MKPSNSTEVVAVLDLPAELDIAARGLYAPELADLVSPDLQERFQTQAKRDINVSVAAAQFSVFAGNVWQSRSQFEVFTEDEPFILAAAQRVISERNVVRKVSNGISGRLQAARTVARFFSTDRKWRTWDT